MKRIRKFSLENYIPEYRDGLKGIHFEDQKAIVTDGHYLIALQNLYPESMENITLNKNFTVWNSDYKFPNWKRVIPDISKGYHGYDIDVKDLSLCYKLKGNSILFKDSEKKLGYVSPYVLDVMIEFMNYFKISNIYIPDDMHSAWKVEAYNTENFMILMPRFEEEFIPYEYDINRNSLTIFQ